MRADCSERSRERSTSEWRNWRVEHDHDRTPSVLNQPGIGVRSPLDSVKIRS